MFTEHAQKRLFWSLWSKIWPCHSLRRPRFPIRRLYFHHRMTFAAYIWYFCAQFSFDLMTLTYKGYLLPFAVSDELSFIHPTHLPIFSILQLSVPELYVAQSDHLTTTWNGYCACAVSCDLSPVGKNDPHFWNPWLQYVFVTFGTLQRRLSHVIGGK